MLAGSFITATAAMTAALAYLFLRLRPHISPTTMLLGSLLLIYGPAYLVYLLSSGEYFRHVLGLADHSAAFSMIRQRVPDIDGVIAAMNFSIALMYAGIIAGIEMISRAAPSSAAAAERALIEWDAQELQDKTDPRLLAAVLILLLLAMTFFSLREDHIGTISRFFSADNNEARNLIRLRDGGSPSYSYRVMLGAIAPMFVIWGLFSGMVGRSWRLLLVAVLLLAATMIGKVETLSKAPPIFFVAQLMLATLLAFSNRISWKLVLFGGAALALVVLVATNLIMVLPEGDSILHRAYSRVFEAETQSLLENFAVFPQIHPHMGGANIRPVAALLNVPFVPAYTIVAEVWYGNRSVTSPSLFIADAWADFSFAGVFIFSVIAGIVCRTIDLFFLPLGKSVVGVAVLAASFLGVLSLLIAALNTALLSGGLLLAPMVAAILVTISRYSAGAGDAATASRDQPTEDGPRHST